MQTALTLARLLLAWLLAVVMIGLTLLVVNTAARGAPAPLARKERPQRDAWACWLGRDLVMEWGEAGGRFGARFEADGTCVTWVLSGTSPGWPGVWVKDGDAVAVSEWANQRDRLEGLPPALRYRMRPAGGCWHDPAGPCGPVLLRDARHDD